MPPEEDQSHCAVRPLLPSAERNKLKYCLAGDSVYGTMTSIMEQVNSSRPIIAHSSFCYQGETFVLNHRNYLI